MFFPCFSFFWEKLWEALQIPQSQWKIVKVLHFRIREPARKFLSMPCDIRLSFHIIFKHQMGLSMLDTVDGSEMPAITRLML